MKPTSFVQPSNPKKTYTFPVELIAEVDGRWSATCPSIEGCTTWGNSHEEAFQNIQEAVEMNVEALRMLGKPIPEEIKQIDTVSLTIQI